MEVLRDVGLPRTWPGGAALFRQHEYAEGVIVIDTGRVRLSRVEPSGLARTIEDRGAGDVLGEFDVLRNGGYSLTAVALQDTTGTVVSRNRFRDTLLLHPAYALKLLERAVARDQDVSLTSDKQEQLRRFEEEQVRFDVFRSALANGDVAILGLHLARHPRDLPKFLSLLEAAPQDAALLTRFERMIDDGLLAESGTRETARKLPVL